MTTTENDPYVQIALQLPNDVAVGGALITMVEPHEGFEAAYNRWYEDDHFYSGAMFGPGVFAGRRWVATRDLQQLRYPKDSRVAQPISRGCYISTYFHQFGHHDEITRWAQVAMADNLYPAGRGFTDRTHVYTTHAPYGFGVVRDADGPMRPWHALSHPYQGMVLEIVDPGDESRRPELARWLEHELIPAQLAGSPISQCLAFLSAPMVGGGAGVVPGVPAVEGQERFIALLWFLDVDPRRTWSRFLGHGDAIAAGGGELLLAAPFIPTIPGTEAYVDELR
jgi:hypothetical protein